MSTVHLDTAILERPSHTETGGRRQRFTSPPATLEENTYHLEFCPDTRKRPYKFVATDDIAALLHIASFLRISAPIGLMAFLAADGKRVVRLQDRRQIFPVHH